VVLPRKTREHKIERLLNELLVQFLGNRHDAVFLARLDLKPDNLGESEKMQAVHEHAARETDDDLFLKCHEDSSSRVWLEASQLSLATEQDAST